MLFLHKLILKIMPKKLFIFVIVSNTINQWFTFYFILVLTDDTIQYHKALNSQEPKWSQLRWIVLINAVNVNFIVAMQKWKEKKENLERQTSTCCFSLNLCQDIHRSVGVPGQGKINHKMKTLLCIIPVRQTLSESEQWSITYSDEQQVLQAA